MPEIKPLPFSALFKPANTLALHNLLNLWAIEDGAVIGLDLHMTFAFELTPPDLLVRSDHQVAEYFQSVKNALHALPDNTALQFLVRISEGDKDLIQRYNDITQPAGDVEKLVVSAKTDHLNSVFLQKKSYYAFLTTSPADSELAGLKSSPFKIVLKQAKRISRQTHDARIRQLRDLSQTFVSSLNAIGIEARQLPEQELGNLIYSYLNPSRSDFLDMKTVDPGRTLRSQVCFNAAEHGFDHVYTDGYYYRGVNLYTRPESVNFAMLEKMLSTLTPPCDVVFSIVTDNQERLQRQVFLAGSIARNINNVSGFRKNYEADALQQDAGQLIEDTKGSYQKLYGYSLAVILRDRTLESLTTRTNAAVQAFRSLGDAEGIIDDMNHLQLTLSGLPGHTHLNFRKHVFQTEAVAQLVPLFGPWQGCKTPRILFQTDDDQLLPIDLFDPALSAKHGIVLGRTGSGKSFTTNFLLTNFSIESEQNHIVIIDIGGSYRKLCSLFGGEYLEIELSEQFAFNPFPSKDIAVVNSRPAAFEVDPDVLSFLTNIVLKLLKLKSITGREQKLLENAITSTYEHCKDDAPVLSGLHHELMHYQGDEEDRRLAKDYAKNLEIWTSGRYGKLLNRKSTLSPQSRLVVFDLQKLSEQPELQGIIFFLITSVIENKLKDISLKKMIVIDEGWKFFNDDIGSQLIENLYRTARKFNAGILSISQNPADFLSTKAASAIISNSYVKYVLPLKSDYELLPQFGINPQEIEEIKTLTGVRGKYSEIFLKFAENSRVIKIEPSPVDYWICTTDPEDRQIEDTFRAEHPGYTEAQILSSLPRKGE